MSSLGLVTILATWLFDDLRHLISFDWTQGRVYIHAFSFFIYSEEFEYDELKMLCALPLVKKVVLDCSYQYYFEEGYMVISNDPLQSCIIETFEEVLLKDKLLLLL